MSDFEQALNVAEENKNLTIFDSFIKANSKIQVKRRMVCAISGGADSDIMLDILTKIDTDKKIKYVFFDTGIEYEATKRHLDYLENKYGVTIEKRKAITPVPLGCRRYGVPFWSKHVSEMIKRLQTHNFKWEDKSFDVLIREYPKCKSALRWWCNDFARKTGKDGKIKESKFNIGYVRGLKEFMISFPPDFAISPDCCLGAKKNNAKVVLKECDADLNMIGVRKTEGGIRGSVYKNCFTPAKETESWDNYRPIFWYTNEDKRQYDDMFNIKHSDCYCVYGLDRTGCAGCPFGKDFEKELEICEKYEPKLHKAILNIFGKSYDYTRKFIEFRNGR